MIGRKEDFAAYDEAFADWYRGLATQGELRIELNLPTPGRQASGRLGRAAGRPGGHGRRRPRRSGARRATRSRGPTRRRRSGSWRAASRCCARSRSPTSPRRSGPGSRRMIRRLAVTVPGRANAADAGPRPRAPRSTSGARSGDRCARRASRSSARWRARKSRTRPLVLILDISGSMAPYSRALMQFGYAAMAAGRRVEVFVLRDAAHARDADAAHEGPRSRAARDRHAGRGLGGRNADRRVAEDAARRVEPARGAARRRGGAVLRRPGARGPRAAEGADGAAAPPRPPGRLGEPAEGLARGTSRSRAGWRPPCRRSTCSCRGTTWRAWSTSAASSAAEDPLPRAR